MSEPYHSHDEEEEEDQDQEQQFDPNDIVEVIEFGDDDDAPMDEDDEEGGLEMVREDEEGDERMEEDEQPVEDNSLGHSLHHNPSTSVFTVALHPLFPNPPLAISGGEDDSGFIFSPISSSSAPSATFSAFQPIKLTGHTDSVIAAQFSSDGELAATGGMDGKVRVWRRVKGKASSGEEGDWSEWQNWEFLTSLDTSDEVTWIAWHPRGPVLAAGCNDSTVWMWQLPTGDTMQVFSAHTDTVTSGLFTPSGKLLITTSADQSLCVWDPRSPAPLLKLAPNATTQFGHFSGEGQGGITCLAIAPSSNLLAVGGANGRIRVINLPNGHVVGQLKGHKAGESIEGLQFMDILGLAGPGGEASGTKGLVLVSCSTDGNAMVWDVTTGNVRAEVAHGDVITSIAPHPAPHRHLFTTGSADKTLRTWDARTGTLIGEHKGHAGVINDVKVGKAPAGWGVEEDASAKDGEVIVSAGDDGAVLVWRV